MASLKEKVSQPMMKYEISADTARILQLGQQMAAKQQLYQTSILCILYSILNGNNALMALLDKMGCNPQVLLNNVVSKMTLEDHSEWNESLSEIPPLDADMQRILKLTVLEDKVTNGKLSGSFIWLLAILHDRLNPAKELLSAHGLTYEALLKTLREENLLVGNFDFPQENESSQPEDHSGHSESTSSNTESPNTASNGDTPVIDNFGVDITLQAQKGILDPVIGRKDEITRVIQILSRRKKNNPIIIGEPGVGKSAIVEGLAERIVHKKVPYTLLNKRIVSLNMAGIVAGTQYRGQFEERLRKLLEELKKHREIILFIDEIHTIIGAGSAPGSLDAANILKPALARNEIQCIGATTTSEYKKSIERDGALERRFQKILLTPTSQEETLEILTNIRRRYEEHHNVKYTDAALWACVNLTARYITNRVLPDKAIDALDEAGACKHLENNIVPKEIEEKEKELSRLRAAKLKAAQAQDYEEAAHLRDEVLLLEIEIKNLTKLWQISQKREPTLITEDDVAAVVSKMSGVPVNRVATDENERLRGMKDALRAKVIDQDRAIARVVKAIVRNRLGLKGQKRPIGTFLFVGPTGVGKTYLVQCLAEWMFGTKDALIRLDMSEYGEKFSVSRMVGAPPGYVGYEEGGQLTERVKRKPYSVILLDEIEKAHPDVFNMLLQVMDEGRLTDGNGETVDFSNTIIILTSNSGTRQLREMGSGIGFDRIDSSRDNAVAETVIKKALKKQFSPEFLNRLDDVVVFNALNKDSAHRIAALEIESLKRRLSENGYEIEMAEGVTDIIVSSGFDTQYGARSLKRAIQEKLEDPICDYMIEHPTEKALAVTVEEGNICIHHKDPTMQKEVSNPHPAPSQTEEG